MMTLHKDVQFGQFWQLEDDILREIISQWLHVTDICLLDQAHCNRKQRKILLNHFRESNLSIAIPSWKESRYFPLDTADIDFDLFTNWVLLRGLVISNAVFDNDTEEGILQRNYKLLRLRESSIVVSKANNVVPFIQSLIPLISEVNKMEVFVSQYPLHENEFVAGLYALLSSSPHLKSLSIFELLPLSVSQLSSIAYHCDLEKLSLPYEYLLNSFIQFFSSDSLFRIVKEFETLSKYFPIEMTYETMFGEPILCIEPTDIICSDCSLTSIQSSLDIVHILSYLINQSRVAPRQSISCKIGTVIPFALNNSFSSLSLLNAHTVMFQHFASIGVNIGTQIKDLSLSLAYFDNRNESSIELPYEVFPSRLSFAQRIDNLSSSETSSIYDLCPHLQELRLHLCNHPLKALNWQDAARNVDTPYNYLTTLKRLAWDMFIGDIPLHLHNLRVLSIRRTFSDTGRSFWMKKPLMHEITDKHIWIFSESLAAGCPLLEILNVSYFPILVPALYGLQHLRQLTIEFLSSVFATADDTFPYYSIIHEQYRDMEGKDSDDKSASKMIPHHFPSLVSVIIRDFSDRCIYRLLEIFCCGVAPQLRSLELQGLGPFLHAHHHVDLVYDEDDDEDDAFLEQDWERIPGVCKYVHDRSFLEYERTMGSLAASIDQEQEDATDWHVFRAKRRPVFRCNPASEQEERGNTESHARRLRRFLALPKPLHALLQEHLKNCPNLQRIRMNKSEKHS